MICRFLSCNKDLKDRVKQNYRIYTRKYQETESIGKFSSCNRIEQESKQQLADRIYTRKS